MFHRNTLEGGYLFVLSVLSKYMWVLNYWEKHILNIMILSFHTHQKQNKNINLLMESFSGHNILSTRLLIYIFYLFIAICIVVIVIPFTMSDFLMLRWFFWHIYCHAFLTYIPRHSNLKNSFGSKMGNLIDLLIDAEKGEG